MPQPTTSDVHVDAVLTNVSIAYMNQASAFISDKVFPMVPVQKQSDKYFIYTKNDWFRNEAKIRAGGTESVGSGYNLSTTTYYCDVVAIHKDVDDQTRANSDSPLNPDRDAAQFVTQRLLVEREIRWQSDCFATSKWATDITGGGGFTVWSNYSASDPITNIETGKYTILASTGLLPNTLVLGYNVFRYLKNHPDIVDRFKYTSSASVTTDMLGQLLGVDRVFVAQALKATNIEGETAAYSMAITGNDALLCYVNPSPSIMAPSAGYQFVWQAVSGGMGAIGIKRFRMEELAADRIEGQIAYDNKITGTDLGYFFSGAVS